MTVVEVLTDDSNTSPMAFHLATPPGAEGDLLFIAYATPLVAPTSAFYQLTINGNGSRLYYEDLLSNYTSASSGEVTFRWYPLEVDDEYIVVTPYFPNLYGVIALFQISDYAQIPDDLFAQVSGEDFANPDTLTVNQTMVAPGLMVAVGMIEPAATLTEPAGWTDAITTDTATSTIQICYNAAVPDGAVSDAWAVGTVAVGGEGAVAAVGVQDIDLRTRDAGAYLGVAGFTIPTAGNEGLSRQFAPESTLPRTAPEPTSIVVPTPPWDTSRSPHRRRV